MKIAAICDPDTGIGLRLLGVHDVFTSDKDPIRVFKEVTQRSDIGIVFITDELASILGRNLREYRLSHSSPIIVELPSSRGRMKGYIDFISYLIKRSIGVDIKVKNVEETDI
ncbi:MAG: V-type ATP synthase subunit F [Candidatus Thermoplasmatota archaeon]